MIEQKCGTCGSSDIVRDIKISSGKGIIGLVYFNPIIFTAREELLSDLCRQCGTVVRMHVENTDRKWMTKF